MISFVFIDHHRECAHSSRFVLCYDLLLVDSWWRHRMETFSALLVICAGNSPVNSPHKGQWRGALMFSLICVWINAWVNYREAGDLRRYHAYYGVTAMFTHHDDVIKWKHFCVTGPLWGESTGHKCQWRGVLCFLWSAPEQTAEQTIETSVIWDAIASIMTPLYWYLSGLPHRQYSNLTFAPVPVNHTRSMPISLKLPHWHQSNLTIAPVPVKQHWRMPICLSIAPLALEQPCDCPSASKHTWSIPISLKIHQSNLTIAPMPIIQHWRIPICLSITPLALEQSYDCPSASDSTLQGTGIQNTCMHTEFIISYTHITTRTYHIYFVLRTLVSEAGGRLNKKDGLTRYGDSRVKDKTS